MFIDPYSLALAVVFTLFGYIWATSNHRKKEKDFANVVVNTTFDMLIKAGYLRVTKENGEEVLVRWDQTNNK